MRNTRLSPYRVLRIRSSTHIDTAPVPNALHVVEDIVTLPLGVDEDNGPLLRNKVQLL